MNYVLFYFYIHEYFNYLEWTLISTRMSLFPCYAYAILCIIFVLTPYISILYKYRLEAT